LVYFYSSLRIVIVVDSGSTYNSLGIVMATFIIVNDYNSLGIVMRVLVNIDYNSLRIVMDILTDIDNNSLRIVIASNYNRCDYNS